MIDKNVVKIIGIGHTLGSCKISNPELSELLKIPESKIIEKTGIINRYHCDTSKENLYTMMCVAFRKATKTAGIDTQSINGLYTSSNPTGDFLLPNPAHIVGNLLDISNYSGGHIGTGCSGGLLALQAANAQLIMDRIKGTNSTYAIMVGDQTSRILSPLSTDQMLFSDGAACIILTNKDVPYYYSIQNIEIRTHTQNNDALKVPHAGLMNHNGRAIYKFASTIMPEILTICNVDPSNLKSSFYFLPHQANLRIIEAQMSRLSLYPESVYTHGVQAIGNTSSASTAIGLEDIIRRNLNMHDNLFIATFGEGLTIGGTILKKGDLTNLKETDNLEDLKKIYMNKYTAKWHDSKSTPQGTLHT